MKSHGRRKMKHWILFSLMCLSFYTFFSRWHVQWKGRRRRGGRRRWRRGNQLCQPTTSTQPMTQKNSPSSAGRRGLMREETEDDEHTHTWHNELLVPLVMWSSSFSCHQTSQIKAWSGPSMRVWAAECTFAGKHSETDRWSFYFYWQLLRTVLFLY